MLYIIYIAYIHTFMHIMRWNRFLWRYERRSLSNVVFFLSLLQSVLRASTNTASGTTSVSRVRRTAKHPTRGCPSAGATPDTTGRPKIRNRCRARVSIILQYNMITIYTYIVRARTIAIAPLNVVIYYCEIIIKIASSERPSGLCEKAVSLLLYILYIV